MSTVYKDYFQIDENYFPCVNESAINAGLKWDEFYPHSTFIDLLKKAERVLSRQDKRSVWISGAYGTGKSYAAFALSKLLTSSNEEVETYFNKYEALAEYKTDLLQRLITAKNEGPIITCYHYASSSINSSNDLIVVMQELVAKAVMNAELEYNGADTLKIGILNWLKDERNKQLFNGYVEKEYKDYFGGWSTDEIIDKLNNLENPAELVVKINQMANEIGILAIRIDMDGLIAYIKDIITKNNLKALVFVLDEFSEYFQNNRGRLTDFQKLVETCVEVPFYLIVVAHQMGSYFHEKDSDAKKIKDRFLPCDISLPDNIAFDLMRDALKIKEDVQADWERKLDDLQDFTKKSRRAVAECTGIKDEVLRGVLPLHPMSALLLKHISSAFESNQRSMFDFIKNDGNYRAFQWFIENHGPLDGTTALLTVDMLWDFFYETGKDNLALPIRNILDTYKKAESHKLVSEEHKVLKTILIMQAVSTHLNDAFPPFISNEHNLYLCFEGTDYEHSASAIADKLVKEEVLYKKTLGNNRFCYATMVMAGDAAELDKKKKEKVEKLRTLDLCIDDMTRVLALTAPLKLRYDLTYATHDDITTKTNRFINEEGLNRFHAIIGVAKDDNEATLLRKLMQEKIRNVIPENKNIVYIDTTPTPFGSDSIELYAEYMAGSEMQRGKDNSAADDMLRKGKLVVGSWGNRIFNNQIIVYSKSNPEGQRYNNWQQVLDGLRGIVKGKYPYIFEFEPGLSEATLQSGSKPQWVEAGIDEKSGGVTASVEKIINALRKDDNYWLTNQFSPLGIIKNALDNRIKTELDENSKVAIKDILTFLCDEFGFVPSNLYSFLAGFLLKEYANDNFRLSDDAVNEKMSTDKMKEIIDEGFKQLYAPTNRYRDKYIRIMSHEEQLFCGLISDIFDIPEYQCGSVEDAVKRARIKAKSFGFPVWVLKEKASGIEIDFLTEFVKLLNPTQGTNASIVSSNIGKLIVSDDDLAKKLKKLMTFENCRESMKSYLTIFEDGKLLQLAREINAEKRFIDDIHKHFGDDTEGLWLWNKETGDAQIRKVINEYEFVKKSNELLGKTNSSLGDSIQAWQEKIKFIKVSHEVAMENTNYHPIVKDLYNIAEGMGKDYFRDFYETLIIKGDAIVDFIKSDRDIFAKMCAFQLQGLSEQEVSDIYNKIPNGSFFSYKQDYLIKIEQIVNDYKSNLAKTKLRKLWKDKTGTDHPYQWSDKYETPILACVPTEKWSDYKRCFGSINRQNPEDVDVMFALEFLSDNSIWEDLLNRDKIDNYFRKVMLGNYKSIFDDLNEVRTYLKQNTSIHVFDWMGNPEISRLVKELALIKYKEEPYGRLMQRIDSMDAFKLKEYLKRLLESNIIVGIEILEDGEEG